jgi:hypothetical protein
VTAAWSTLFDAAVVALVPHVTSTASCQSVAARCIPPPVVFFLPTTPPHDSAFVIGVCCLRMRTDDNVIVWEQGGADGGRFERARGASHAALASRARPLFTRVGGAAHDVLRPAVPRRPSPPQL